MRILMNRLWRDESGVILSAEIVIVGSLLVVGMITGLTCLQEAVNGELRDVAGAIGALDQSFSFSAHRKAGFNGQCCAYTAGSAYENCETCVTDGCHDIAGCVDSQVIGGSACCVGREGDQPCSTDGCSGCGRVPCVSGSFIGGAGIGSAGASGPRCLDTDVPGMKVTEWPAVPVEIDAANPSMAPLGDAGCSPECGHTGECAPVGPAEDIGGHRYHDVIIPDHVW